MQGKKLLWLHKLMIMHISNSSQPFSKNEPYRVPAKILESQSLTNLSLTRCLPNIGNLCSLVELRLESVRLDEEALQMILHYCPLMEVFSLLYCHHRRCKLSGHPRLRSVLFTAARGNEKFSIENVPNLEELELNGSLSDEQASFEISSSCQKLSRLKLLSILIVSNEWLQNTISPFDSLEYLELSSCSMEDVLKLSCPRLKEIVLSDCKNLVRTELDAPVLHTLRYSGDCMFRSSSIIAGKRTASLYVRRVDNPWFIGLIDFLRCNRFQELNITLGVLRSGYGRCRSDREIYFSAEELDHPVPPPFELENLNLELITSPTLPLENSGLLDGLLWSCRPKNITLLLTRTSAAETLKELLARLVVEQNPKCSPLSWRHFLKDVKLKYARGFDKGIPLNSSTLNSFFTYLDRCILEARKRERHFSLRDVSKNEILCFTLSWKDSIPVPAASIEAH